MSVTDTVFAQRQMVLLLPMHLRQNWNVSTCSISVFRENAPLMSRFTFPLSSRELEQKIHSRMSGPDHDDLLDFFDHTKPFKRVNLRQVSNKIGRWNYMLEYSEFQASFLQSNQCTQSETMGRGMEAEVGFQ